MTLVYCLSMHGSSNIAPKYAARIDTATDYQKTGQRVHGANALFKLPSSEIGAKGTRRGCVRYKETKAVSDLKPKLNENPLLGSYKNCRQQVQFQKQRRRREVNRNKQ